MAKRDREQAMREKRARKQQKKEERKQAALAPEPTGEAGLAEGDENGDPQHATEGPVPVDDPAPATPPE